ncbi:histidine kinase [Bifidobacterium sp. ESL0728]|uniref:sensor histidine kinase n=1 Tax=Bifidobacterium sp. ESL0728 TaxID=2983220 RepID=UPI0023F9E0EB|nr:histidine kinase [Bifidobacterium sp. ESL0728]WEV59614.1 histidine kinase [Bifidobacterium sp. ESL0728]
MSTVKLTDQIRSACSRMNGAHVLAVLCALYETVIVTRLLLVPGIANPTLRLAMTASAWAMPVFVLIVVVAVIGIWFCRHWPLWILLLETALFLSVSALYGSAFSYLSLPWAIALYFVAAGIESLPLRICGLVAAGLLGLGGVVLATVWHQDAGLTNFLYPFILLYVVFVATGLIVRNFRERRQSEHALQNAQERGEKLALERDRAMRQSRIAAELHDSVGHDLTAIIALSEGLDGVSDKPEMNDAIGMINDLARQGLADTRTAVKALQPDNRGDGDKGVFAGNRQDVEQDIGIAGDSRFRNSNIGKTIEKSDDKRNENRDQDNGNKRNDNKRNDDFSQKDGTHVAFSLGRLHDWDDINPILDHSRQIGITTALTETGRRPQDPQQADLSFAVTRECITNAIRHGQEVDRIVVSWDHDGQGGIAVTVRDNGKSTDKSRSDIEDGKDSVASVMQNGKAETVHSELGDGDGSVEFDQSDKHVPAQFNDENIGEVESRQSGKNRPKFGEYSDGTGLTRLKKSVKRGGGTFAAGPDADGWTVKAYIPSLMGFASKQSQGGGQR